MVSLKKNHKIFLDNIGNQMRSISKKSPVLILFIESIKSTGFSIRSI